MGILGDDSAMQIAGLAMMQGTPVAQALNQGAQVSALQQHTAQAQQEQDYQSQLIAQQQQLRQNIGNSNVNVTDPQGSIQRLMANGASLEQAMAMFKVAADSAVSQRSMGMQQQILNGMNPPAVSDQSSAPDPSSGAPSSSPAASAPLPSLPSADPSLAASPVPDIAGQFAQGMQVPSITPPGGTATNGTGTTASGADQFGQFPQGAGAAALNDKVAKAQKLMTLAALSGNKELAASMRDVYNKALDEQKTAATNAYNANNKPLPESTAKSIGLADQGLDAVNDIKKQAFNADGTPNKSAIALANLHLGNHRLQFTPESQQLYNSIYRATSSAIHTDSGARPSQESVDAEIAATGPSPFDNADSLNAKLDKLSAKFQNAKNLMGRSAPSSAYQTPASASSATVNSIKNSVLPQDAIAELQRRGKL